MKVNLSFLVLVLTATIAYAQICQTSDDCPGNGFYCAQGTCLEVSKCSTRDDCLNPANSPYALPACVGYVVCTEGQCGMECGSEQCPNGGEYSPCPSNNLPCDLVRCGQGAVGCYNDPCGNDGCTAMFFDAAGNRTCIPDDAAPTPLTCASDSDCADGSYCAGGTCLEVSKCNQVLDCKNPSNGPFMLPACEGPLVCSDTNQCGINCSSSVCADGSELANCFVNPCDVETCDGSVSCAQDLCGCKAIFFDAAGNQVCATTPANTTEESQVPNANTTNNTSINNSTSLSCTNNTDCGDGFYCAGGTCLEVSQCNQVLDCMNPANSPYILPACVGPLVCSNNNQCGINCSNSFCADGSESVACDVNPCDVETCDGSVSCSQDLCLCKAIFFDAAGNQVCATTQAPTNTTNGTQLPNATTNTIDGPCTSNADCVSSTTAVARSSTPDGSAIDDQYCSQGVCSDMGSCSSDLDCFNPSNIYAAKYCTGYLTCSQGLCDVVCGPACPDGSEGYDCTDRVCDVVDCPGAVSCSTDMCNDCVPTYYDAAGFPKINCTVADGGETPTLFDSAPSSEEEPSDASSFYAPSMMIGAVGGMLLIAAM